MQGEEHEHEHEQEHGEGRRALDRLAEGVSVLDRLAEGVSALDKSQHIKKATRGAQPLQQDGGTQPNNTIQLHNLIKVLQKGGKQTLTAVNLVKKAATQRKLDPPLDKRVTEKSARQIGYTQVVQQLNQWEPAITSNRAKLHRRFPEHILEPNKKPVEELLKKFTLTSDLEKKLNALEPAEEEVKEVDEFPMTLEEIVERRREVARLRAKQSYKEAEARRRGKIKSKKFHRIQRKEKIKRQMKEFEELQKTDPEEALRRLEQLEKTRAEERVSLRHKSTGQWAKNKLVRAKYNKETRQELAEQLSIGRSLTQKVSREQSESEKEDDDLPNDVDPNNPWLSNIGKPDENVNDFVSGYRKYWEAKKNSADSVKAEADSTTAAVDPCPRSIADALDHSEQLSVEKTSKKKRKNTTKTGATSEWEVEDISFQLDNDKNKILPTQKKNVSVVDMFDDLEQQLQDKVNRKIKKLNKKNLKETKRDNFLKKEKAKKGKEKYEVDLSFKKSIDKPIIDEELDESTDKNMTRKAETQKGLNIPVDVGSKVIDKIDPSNFVAPKPKHLSTTLPDVDMGEDDIDDAQTERRLTIAEAFEDDDIVAEFLEEKENEKNADKPNLMEVTMPGWGSWVTKTNVNRPRKTKRLISKLPDPARKDDKKSNVIINERKLKELVDHQVSELPFPFTKVKDFEATIRAPIGNTFIPQTAHKKLVKPAVVTRAGVPIEPIDESILVDRKNMKLKL